MIPHPLEHRFEIEGERYLLVEWTRGGERRIKTEYALAIAAAPGVIDSIDGQNLYAEAVARECLKEAPPLFWEDLPALAGQNGTPRRQITLEHVPRQLWDLFRVEVDRFLGHLFPPAPTESQGPSDAGPAAPEPVAVAQTVSPMLRGRAE